MDREVQRIRKGGEDVWAPSEIRCTVSPRLKFRHCLQLNWRPYRTLLIEPIVAFLSLPSGFSDALIFTALDFCLHGAEQMGVYLGSRRPLVLTTFIRHFLLERRHWYEIPAGHPDVDPERRRGGPIYLRLCILRQARALTQEIKASKAADLLLLRPKTDGAEDCRRSDLRSQNERNFDYCPFIVWEPFAIWTFAKVIEDFSLRTELYGIGSKGCVVIPYRGLTTAIELYLISRDPTQRRTRSHKVQR
nr:hypothetical protein CFP56_37086 [Quercus suber]